MQTEVLLGSIFCCFIRSNLKDSGFSEAREKNKFVLPWHHFLEVDFENKTSTKTVHKFF